MLNLGEYTHRHNTNTYGNCHGCDARFCPRCHVRVHHTMNREPLTEYPNTCTRCHGPATPWTMEEAKRNMYSGT